MKSFDQFLNEASDVLSKVEQLAKQMEKAWLKSNPDGLYRYYVQKGRKYIKITSGNDGKGTSVVAFVDATTGDIYKPAGWKAPAKGARGNINDNLGAKALDATGYNIRYLK